jgi:hypothetical protein
MHTFTSKIFFQNKKRSKQKLRVLATLKLCAHLSNLLNDLQMQSALESFTFLAGNQMCRRCSENWPSLGIFSRNIIRNFTLSVLDLWLQVSSFLTYFYVNAQIIQLRNNETLAATFQENISMLRTKHLVYRHRHFGLLVGPDGTGKNQLKDLFGHLSTVKLNYSSAS